MEQTTTSATTINPPAATSEHKVVAKVVDAGKEYKVGDTTIVALKASSMELRAGEMLLIIGPSGSGKTTLLSLLGCVIYPNYGEVWIDDVRVCLETISLYK